MQSKKRSLIESTVSTGVGIVWAVPLNYFLIHVVQWPDPWIQSFVITVIFVILSISMKYPIRRFFNWWDSKEDFEDITMGNITYSFKDKKIYLRR